MSIKALPVLKAIICIKVARLCSGSGKSTVAALLSRFYAPDKGELLLNGQPASSFTRGEWARAVSVVQQEPILFGGKHLVYQISGHFGKASIDMKCMKYS